MGRIFSMRVFVCIKALTIIAGVTLPAAPAKAQTIPHMEALRGLAPVSALGNTDAGRAALTANLIATGRIQDGSARQPTLLPFAEQQQQALRDAFITWGNAEQLADGLGSELSAIYCARTSYVSADDGEISHFTNVSPTVSRLIAYTVATTEVDSGAAKYFFADGTLGKATPAPDKVRAILMEFDGTTDVFGRVYHLVAGSAGADDFGNSRPFQTEPHLTTFDGRDYFGVQGSNVAYLRGPAQNLTNSPSYPSGHTTYGYTEALLLAFLVPRRYPEMIARAAEFGNDRIIIGAHYAMDVLGGRTLALYDVAQLLANKPAYVGVPRHGLEIDDFSAALTAARKDLTDALQAGCSDTIAACAEQDQSRFATLAADRIAYEMTQTYDLPVVFAGNANRTEDVEKSAPEAGYLLTAAFPYLTLSRADAILTATEGAGGGFLDSGSAFGVYSRLDLFRAAETAISMAPSGVGHN
jgi:hypothetical protein